MMLFVDELLFRNSLFPGKGQLLIVIDRTAYIMYATYVIKACLGWESDAVDSQANALTQA